MFYYFCTFNITFLKCFTILVCLGIIILGINIIKITLNLPTKRKDTQKNLPIFYTIFGATEELASTTLSEGGKVIAICGATTIDMKNSKLMFNDISSRSKADNPKYIKEYNITANKIGLSKARLDVAATWKTYGMISTRRYIDGVVYSQVYLPVNLL